LGIEVSKAAKTWLAKEGYDPVFGARPLRRAIERHIENPLSTKLLRGEFSPGDTIIVGLKNNVLTFKVKAAVKAAA
jgi:ATP-dependent Clp protease ATP-binding subunit ClpC